MGEEDFVFAVAQFAFDLLNVLSLDALQLLDVAHVASPFIVIVRETLLTDWLQISQAIKVERVLAVPVDVANILVLFLVEV